MQSLKIISDIFFNKLKINKLSFIFIILLNIIIVITELIGISAIIPLIQFITNNEVNIFFIKNISQEDLLLYFFIVCFFFNI